MFSDDDGFVLDKAAAMMEVSSFRRIYLNILVVCMKLRSTSNVSTSNFTN